MLFAAGMGIGLMFFGVSEPLSHFGSSFGGIAVENGVRTDWLRSAPRQAMPKRLRGSPWRRRSSTGHCIPGRSTRSSRSAWRCSRSTKGPAADRALAVLPLAG